MKIHSTGFFLLFDRANKNCHMCGLHCAAVGQRHSRLSLQPPVLSMHPRPAFPWLQGPSRWGSPATFPSSSFLLPASLLLKLPDPGPESRNPADSGMESPLAITAPACATRHLLPLLGGQEAVPFLRADSTKCGWTALRRRAVGIRFDLLLYCKRHRMRSLGHDGLIAVISPWKKVPTSLGFRPALYEAKETLRSSYFIKSSRILYQIKCHVSQFLLF